MFAGKTEELIRRLRRAVFAKQTITVYKPDIDKRYGLDNITAHSSLDLTVATGIVPTVLPCDLSEHNDLPITSDDVIAFDEVQFFDATVVQMARFYVSKGKRVICAGLDLDRDGNPFGQMPLLLVHADEVTKITAICAKCQEVATRSFYLGEKVEGQNVVGGTESYEPRCKRCWLLPA